MSSKEDKVLGRIFNLNGFDPLESEMFNHIPELILLEVADPEGDIILLHEHLIALKDVALPEVLLKLGEGVEDLQHQVLLDLNNLGHGVGGGLGVVDVSH